MLSGFESLPPSHSRPASSFFPALRRFSFHLAASNNDLAAASVLGVPPVGQGIVRSRAARLAAAGPRALGANARRGAESPRRLVVVERRRLTERRAVVPVHALHRRRRERVERLI